MITRRSALELMIGGQAMALSGCRASERDLVRRFNRDRAKFEQLLVMFRADPEIDRIDAKRGPPLAPSQITLKAEGAPLPIERAASYRALMSDLKLSSLVRDDQDVFLFYCYDTYFLVRDTYTAYIWSKSTPQNIVEHLYGNTRSGEHRVSRDGAYISHRALISNWYLMTEDY